jgi:hypothetical protein
MEKAGGTLRSALDPVVHVGDTVLPLEDPGALQLDVLGAALVEETAPLTEEHRGKMDLELKPARPFPQKPCPGVAPRRPSS